MLVIFIFSSANGLLLSLGQYIYTYVYLLKVLLSISMGRYYSMTWLSCASVELNCLAQMANLLVHIHEQQLVSCCILQRRTRLAQSLYHAKWSFSLFACRMKLSCYLHVSIVAMPYHTCALYCYWHTIVMLYMYSFIHSLSVALAHIYILCFAHLDQRSKCKYGRETGMRLIIIVWVNI